MRVYATIIVRHSYMVTFIVSLLSILLAAIPLIFEKFPSFSDPVAGFETRGTTLASRSIAWENLIEESRPSRSLVVNPQDIEDEIKMNNTIKLIEKYGKKRKHKHRNNKKKNKVPKLIFEDTDYDNQSQHEHFSYNSNISYVESELDMTKKENRVKQWRLLKNLTTDEKSFKKNLSKYNDHFCGSPVPDYAHFVIQTNDKSSLLEYKNILSICKLQSKIVNVDTILYDNKCEKPAHSDLSSCCPVWSLPNYVAVLTNKTDCLDVTKKDVDYVKDLLKKCAPYFHSLKLPGDCTLNNCDVPPDCAEYNAVYNILYYLIDAFTFPTNISSNNFTEYSMMFMPIPCSSTILPFYLKLDKHTLIQDNVEVVAMDFGLKNALFDAWLIEDMWLVALGGIFVFMCVWFYSQSLFLTLMLIVSVIYSLGISYFIYVYIYQLEFFPFMNLLVAVIVIGIGADDAFLYLKIWESVKVQILNYNNTEQLCLTSKTPLTHSETVLIDIVHETLKHSFITMLVTTITTAVAFFASYISYIPAINCFSVFAGTAVMVNFLVLIMWMPAAVFILESKINSKFNLKCKAIFSSLGEMFSESRKIVIRFVTYTVSKLYFLWILLLGGYGIGSCFVVFHYPGLQLPDTKYFQLFSGDHFFERYDSYYKDFFVFERFNKDWMYGGKSPLRWVWGLHPIDNGNTMNPSSQGHLELNPSFNISHPHSQTWLMNFCYKLRAEDFYQTTTGPMFSNCFIESFVNWMERPCIDPVDELDRSPCCEASSFPFKPEIFDFCIGKEVESLYRTPRQFFVPGVSGPKFLKSSNPLKIVAIVVEFESVQSFTMSYSVMDKFYQKVENWTQQQLLTAPAGMRDGWFFSDLQFYDLQNTLASGTLIALGLSSALGFIILLPSTLSITLSVCGVIAMGFSVTATVSILIFLGWKLNVLESIAISTSAGLAVDFTLHYTLSYTHCKGQRQARTIAALTSALSPTAAAAITTGFSGIFLLNSKILPYKQIGLFFAVIMTVSWIYSTWFLCSLLYVIGPQEPKGPSTNRQRSTSAISSICSGLPNVESHELKNISNVGRSNMPKSPSNASAITVMLHSTEAEAGQSLNLD